ncbi:MAG TPA: prepilin-type N-terminal cleavage/methylation domain-containing protein [Ktedonobacterales bacterium]|nr:prepilin-type N-terminal cleavage/methylation domain-containing protein [Ktedonobacterales bacterium]
MRKSAQAGFTLIEVMIASVTSMFIIMPALVFMFRSYDWYASVESELMLNRKARQVFDLIGNGAKASTNGTDGLPYLYGIHGRNAAPSASSLRSNYTLQYASNNMTVTGDSIAAMTVTCRAAGAPMPDCGAAGDSRTVAGWIGNDFAIDASSGSVNSRTVEVTLTLTDPFQAQRADNPATATQTYHTLLTLNRDTPDP